MRLESVRGYLRAQPFRPFRLVMNSGRTYDVRHPDFLSLGRDVCLYFYRTSPDEPFDRWESVSLMSIEHIEHRNQAVA